MSKRSCRLFRDGESSTWKAEITFSDGGRPTTIDTKTTDLVQAERRAAVVQRQREATRRWRSRQAAAAGGAGAPVGAEIRHPVAPRKKTTARPPARAARRRPALDHEAIARRLRALGGGAPEPDDPGLGPEDPTPAPPAPPPADGTPASDAPPLPPPPPPIIPEIVDEERRQSDADKDMFSSMIGAGLVAAFIRGQRWLAEASKPPLDLARAHDGSVDWCSTGLSNVIRKRIGDRVISDGAKIGFGALGITISMWLGAEPQVKSPTAGDAASAPPTREAEGSGGRPTPPANPPPAPQQPRLNGVHQETKRGGIAPPEDSAMGRF